MWKVTFDLQLPGFTGNSCFIPHIASNLLEDPFEIWIDITLRNRLLREREKNMNNGFRNCGDNKISDFSVSHLLDLSVNVLL